MGLKGADHRLTGGIVRQSAAESNKKVKGTFPGGDPGCKGGGWVRARLRSQEKEREAKGRGRLGGPAESFPRRTEKKLLKLASLESHWSGLLSFVGSRLGMLGDGLPFYKETRTSLIN